MKTLYKIIGTIGIGTLVGVGIQEYRIHTLRKKLISNYNQIIELADDLIHAYCLEKESHENLL